MPTKRHYLKVLMGTQSKLNRIIITLDSNYLPFNNKFVLIQYALAITDHQLIFIITKKISCTIASVYNIWTLKDREGVIGL